MAIRCAILLLWITIGTSAQAQDCFYQQETQYQNGTAINSVTKYDCESPPEVIVIEKPVKAKQRTFGEFLFGVEEENNGVSHLFSTLVSIGVM
jgi:hypothetical protein